MFKSKKLILLSMVMMGNISISHASEYSAKQIEIDRPEKGAAVEGVYDYEREAYNARKLRFGSFIVSPSVGIDVLYDDNIYATKNDKKSDLINIIKPSVGIESDWSRHQLKGNFYSDIAMYSDYDDENYENYGFAVSGRFDVKRNSYAMANLSSDIRHEGRGSPDSTVSSIEPTEYSDTNFGLGYVHAQGLISLGAFYKYKKLNYDDGKTSSGTILENDDRDRIVDDYMVQLGYELKPGYNLFVRSSFIDTKYDMSAANNRDNDGYTNVVGANIGLGGKLEAEIYAGYMKRDYNFSGFKGINDYTYGLNVLWNINGLTSVNAFLSRSIEETTENGASAYINSYASLGLQHEFRRNIYMSAGVSYANYDYIGYNVSREDDYYTFSTEVNYLLNRNIKLSLAYDYLTRNSNVNTSDYDNNIFLFKLAYSF